MSNRIEVEYLTLPIGADYFRKADSEGACTKSGVGHAYAGRGRLVWVDVVEIKGIQVEGRCVRPSPPLEERVEVEYASLPVGATYFCGKEGTGIPYVKIGSGEGVQETVYVRRSEVEPSKVGPAFSRDALVIPN